MEENDELNKEIQMKSIDCYCNTKIKLSKWNDHSQNCNSYIKIINENIKKATIKEEKKTVNRSTFNCPCCKEKNLDREALILHCKKFHKNDEAVCPICVCQPSKSSCRAGRRKI